jgi:hypothetical protein
MVRPREIADWMRQQLQEQGWLAQDEVVAYLREECAGAFLHRTKYGRGAISTRLLAEFRRLTPSGVVWSRRERRWRLARPGDASDRRMAE